MKIKTIIIGMGSAGALDRFIDKRIKFQRNHLDAIKNNMPLVRFEFKCVIFKYLNLKSSINYYLNLIYLHNSQ